MKTKTMLLCLLFTNTFIEHGGAKMEILKSFGCQEFCGAHPQAKLIKGSDGVLYGTTSDGGVYGYSPGCGTVFRINPDGSGARILHSFTRGWDGAYPMAGLVDGTDGALYGTAHNGGDDDGGVVFKLSRDGSGFTVLHDFRMSPVPAHTNGFYPCGNIIEGADGRLYGTTIQGGQYGNGVVFGLNKDGSGYTVLHSLQPPDSYCHDGRGCGLMQGQDGKLYGTIPLSRSWRPTSTGFIFRLNTNGSSFTSLHGSDAVPRDALWQATDGWLYGVGDGGDHKAGVAFRVRTNLSDFQILRHFSTEAQEAHAPRGPLLEADDGRLYGVAYGGGNNGAGAVFGMNKDGSGFTLLRQFPGSAGDGTWPSAGLVRGQDGALYGVTEYGGAYTNGTVFTIRTNGAGYARLASFSFWADGRCPKGELLQASDGALYGTTVMGYDGKGYSEANGTVFKMNLDGSGYRILRNFGWLQDGSAPAAGLIEGADGTLYGTTTDGGNMVMNGTVFRMNKDGSGFQVLHHFAGLPDGDGRKSEAGLILASDGMLYGVTRWGGNKGDGDFGYGTVFKLSTSGAGYEVIHRFDGSDGAEPFAKLLEGSDGRLYGTTYKSWDGLGVAFRLNKDGTDYQVVKRLEGASIGHLVEGNDGTLFGTTINGGRNNRGVVFSVKKDGTDYRLLHELDGWSSATTFRATGLLLSSAGVLYGTTIDGGDGKGIVFRLLQNGYGYEELHRFRSDYTEGARPLAPLIRGTNGALYGTCYEGGAGNWQAGTSCNLEGTVFRLDVPPEHLPPLIVTQPFSQTVQQGSNAQFRVVVSGTAPFNYQWCLHDTSLPQARQATLTLTNVQPGSAGPYYVIVTNDYGTVTSRVARLTVVNLDNPTNYTISLSKGLNLIANQLDLWNNRLDEIMPNVPEGCVVWKFDNWTQEWENTAFDGGQWENGSITLSPGEGAFFHAPQPFNLTFLGQRRQPILPLQLVGGYNLVSRQTPDPAAYEDIVGLSPVESTALYRYQWVYTMYVYLDDEWSPYAPLANVGEAVWIYGLGTSPVVLPPAISTQPTNQAVPCAGGAVFTVSAVGNQPLAYQWRHLGQPLIGATNSVLLLSNVSHSVAGAYEAEVANSAGSVTSVLAYLTVVDTTEPAIACPTGLVLAAGANCQALMPDIVPQAIATDGCGGVTVTQNPAAGTWLGLGTNLVLMSATDDAGNTNTCTVVVAVLDITPPVVAANPSNTVECGEAWPAPAAWDGCCGNKVTVWLASSNLVSSVPPCQAVWTAVWNVMDCWGNVAIHTQIVTVVDRTPPLVTCSSNIGAEYAGCEGTIVSFPAPIGSDHCDPAPTVTCTPPSGSRFCSGCTTVTCRAVDGCGNASGCTFTITVTSPPRPTLRITLAETNCTICWAQTCTGFVLQEADLLDPPQWAYSQAAILPTGNDYCVTVSCRADMKFFRLTDQLAGGVYPWVSNATAELQQVTSLLFGPDKALFAAERDTGRIYRITKTP